MNRWIKITALIICVAVVFCLSGCESSQINEAKKCVDEIFENTLEITELEIELARKEGTGDTTTIRIKIDLCEKMIDSNTRKLETIMDDLSEKGRQTVNDYLAEVTERELSKILGD